MLCRNFEMLLTDNLKVMTILKMNHQCSKKILKPGYHPLLLSSLVLYQYQLLKTKSQDQEDIFLKDHHSIDLLLIL